MPVTVPDRFHNVSLAGNTAGALAEVQSGTLVLAGGNNVTLSQNGNSITISGRNLLSAGMSALGNTVGDTGVVDRRLVLAGGNNVTLSGSTAAGGSMSITISAANQTVQPEGTQTIGMSNIGNTSGNTTPVTGTGIQIVLAGGNNITLSQSTNGSSATITISAGAGGAGLSAGLSNVGNTSGDTGLASQRLVFAGGNNITLSGSTNGGSMTVTISGANAGGAQTGISGIANSETTYTSGSVTFSALGALTIRSTTGQHLQFSVNPQTVESNTLGMSNIGNTAGDTAIRSGAQLQIVLAGGNNVTLSQSTNGASATITISAFNQSVQPEGTQTVGMSNVGNTSGDTTPITGTGIRFVLAGGNNITLSQSTNGSSATVTISAFNQSVQPEGTQTIGMSNAGNTSGDTTPITGTGVRLVLAGGNNITLSQSTNGSSATVTISAFNQSVQPIGTNTIGMSNIGNTAGDSAIRTGTGIQIVLAGGNNITLSQSTNGSSATITISAFNQTAPVVGNAIQSVSSATNSGAATSRFAAEDHVHAGVGPLGVSNIGNTSGDTGTQYGRVVLAGGNNITLSVSSSNNGAQTITVSAAGGGAAGTQTIGMSNVGNTSGDTTPITGTGVRFVLAGGNNITLSQSTNGSSATVTISAFNQTQENQTIGMSNIGNTSGDTVIRSGPQLRIVLAGGNNITLSQSTNGSSATITVSAFNQSVQPIGTNTIGMSNIGNTSGDTAIRTGTGMQIVLAGGNNITLSQSTNGSSATITISAGAGAGLQAGLSNIGNTAGDTGTITGRLVLAGGNNITLSGSTNAGSMTITISAGAGGAGFSAGQSNLGNAFGDTGLVSQQLVLVGGDGVGLSGSTNGGSATITVLDVRTLKSWAVPHVPEMKSPGTLGNASFFVQPWYCPGYLTAHSMLMIVSASGASSNSGAITVPIGVYTQDVGANSTRLSLIASAQFTTSWTSNSVANGDWLGVFGLRRWAMGIDVTFTPGHYWIGVGYRSTNAGTFSFAGNASQQALSGVLGHSNVTRQMAPFMGAFNTTTLTAPNSIGSSAIQQGNNVRVQPWVGFANSNEVPLGA